MKTDSFPSKLAMVAIAVLTSASELSAQVHPDDLNRTIPISVAKTIHVTGRVVTPNGDSGGEGPGRRLVIGILTIVATQRSANHECPTHGRTLHGTRPHRRERNVFDEAVGSIPWTERRCRHRGSCARIRYRSVGAEC